MDDNLRIVIAEDDEDHCVLLERALIRIGHQVVGKANTGLQLVEWCRRENPDLVITDIQMPDMDGLDAAGQIYSTAPLPIIVVTSQLNEDYVRRAEEQHILGFLVKPISEKELVPAIAIVMRRFAEFAELTQQNASLQQALHDRKVIERAKGLLMRQASIDEAEAFGRLQKLARDKRTKLVEIAEAIVTASEAMS